MPPDCKKEGLIFEEFLGVGPQTPPPPNVRRIHLLHHTSDLFERYQILSHKLFVINASFAALQ